MLQNKQNHFMCIQYFITQSKWRRALIFNIRGKKKLKKNQNAWRRKRKQEIFGKGDALYITSALKMKSSTRVQILDVAVYISLYANTHNPTSVLENDTQTPMGFWDTNGSPNLSQTTRPYNNQQKRRRTCKIVDHRVKLKESEKRDLVPRRS